MKLRRIKYNFWDSEEKVMILHNSQKVILIPCIDDMGADTHYESKRKNTNPNDHSLEGNWFNDESCFDWASAWLIGGRFIPLQWTGLKDSRGKEIYEGDIIKIGEALFPVTYESQSFYPALMYMGEVVGNIFENPALLQEAIKYDEEN